MTVLDTFYFLFKSNAKDAATDVEKLDAQIVKTGHSTRKAFLEDQKQQAELKKQRTEAIQKTKEQNSVVEELGDSLLSLGLKALAGYSAFGAVKGIAQDAFNLNLNLQKTRALIGQNSEEIQAWDQAFERTGVSAGAFTDFYTNAVIQIEKLNQNPDALLPYLKSVANEIKNAKDEQSKWLILQQRGAAVPGGIPDEFMVALRNGSDALDEIAGKQGKFIKSNKDSENSVRDFLSSFQNLESSLVGLFTRLFSHILPFQTAWNNILATIFAGNFGLTDIAKAYASGFTLPKNVIPSASTKNVLPLISQYESSNRNIPNATGPGGSPESTASGYYQITNETWRDFAPQAGFSLSQYPTAITAPRDVQEKVASLIYEKRGIQPWASNTNLLAALAANKVNEADKSPLNSAPAGAGGNSISIGSITINSQAKDANGIAQDIEDSLKRHFRATISNWDDGVAK